ncbi:MAG: hypothetical protein QNJ94_21120 [Alphaproteobacteria bacterium]|nr:hypothetical protein [Alphaproteobacteria bacterium]
MLDILTRSIALAARIDVPSEAEIFAPSGPSRIGRWVRALGRTIRAAAVGVGRAQSRRPTSPAALAARTGGRATATSRSPVATHRKTGFQAADRPATTHDRVIRRAA